MSEATGQKRTKVCKGCGITKDIDDFSKCGLTAKGTQKYRSHCKPCYNPQARVEQRAKGETIEGRAYVLLKSAEQRCRTQNKGMTVAVTQEWIEDKIRAGTCEATGIPFDLAIGRGRARYNPHAPSLDRRDPAHGYTPENTQVVITQYNTMKGEWHEDYALLLARSLLDYQARR